MSKVIYYGNEDNKYVLDSYCIKNGYEKSFHICNEYSLVNLYNDVCQESPSYIFFDLDRICDERKTVLEQLSKLKIATRATIAIIAITYNTEMSFIQDLIAIGIVNFVFSESLTPQKREIENVFSGNLSVSEKEKETIISNREERIGKFLEAVPEETVSSEIEISNKVRIAVVGCRDRIGTTTVALQFIKYLQLSGKEACYIERNSTGFLEIFSKYIISDTDYTQGKIKYNDTDLFFKPEVINQVLQDDYEVYVTDYGSIAEADSLSLLEQDVILVVCGNFPSELANNDSLFSLLEKHSDVYYIFNFVGPEDYNNVLECQGSMKDRTFFMDFCPDPFIYRPKNEACFNFINERDNDKGKVLKKKKTRKRGFLWK